MALPRWLARLNRAVFNPLELRRGERPVLEHVGRMSGRRFSTPLDAHLVEGGVVFTPLYGPDTDWVRNVLAAGHATLSLDGETIDLVDPRLVGEDDLPPSVDRPPRWIGVDRFLHLDRS